MVGLMDKGAGTTQQMPGALAQLFAGNQPAVAPTAPTQVPPIAAPQYGPSLMPSPEQAMAATRARMLARTPAQPLAQPTTRPQQGFVHGGGSNR